ncbi:hypothetical protein BST97_06430 [Nonlabens spongiae]|uniref:Uncharacterized protein n=1 Tax=Nonlabens spongiae TaxID=331648 RepID=A0A1W6MJ90_9FLAO|nr:PspC domain-containing protein [Nonlabens spongiae]ARN77660.1 hypothetical protein BST97_06430 [Nonlabens spongiae]
MNKTININLAGLFFHIDEDAYNRLQKYLASVKKSFSGTQGADEIMRDIESRVAELFLEKRKNEQQVISIQHVEEVIEIMGQPEDYEVDEDIFEEQPRARRNRGQFQGKQLFRDTANGYVGGVCAGLGHYINLDAIWVRLIWVFLFISSVGWLIPIYILLWILVPDAVTKIERLKMMGKEVNISNLGNTSEGNFDQVADEQTSASHHIVGQKGKRGSVRFFGLLGRFFKNIFKILFKIIGLLVFLASTIGLISIIVSLFTVAFIDVDGQNLIHFFDIVIPWENVTWLLFLAIILATCIPLLVLAILGLKMLVRNMKSIGTPAKIILVILWVASIIFLSITIGRVAANQAFEAKIPDVERFEVDENLFELNLQSLEELDNAVYVNSHNFDMVEYNGTIALRNRNLRVALASTKDSVARVVLTHSARGGSYEKAKENASQLVYEYNVEQNRFTAPEYVIIPKGYGFFQQETQVVIYLPEGTTFKLNRKFYDRYRSWLNDDTIRIPHGWDHHYIMEKNEAICLDCEDIEEPSKAQDPIDEVLQEEADSIQNDFNENQWKYEEEN